MRKDHCCICKFKPDHSHKNGEDSIFDSKGNSINITLCYTHSVELFKTGQKAFLLRHKNSFSEKIGSENHLELVDYMSGEDRERSWY